MSVQSWACLVVLSAQGIQDEDQALSFLSLWALSHKRLLSPSCIHMPTYDSGFPRNNEMKAPSRKATLALLYALPKCTMETMPGTPRTRGSQDLLEGHRRPGDGELVSGMRGGRPKDQREGERCPGVSGYLPFPDGTMSSWLQDSADLTTWTHANSLLLRWSAVND